MNRIVFDFAGPSDTEAVQCLLASCDLPTDDVAEHLDHFIVAASGKVACGVIGLELLGNLALLRSLAVAKPYRGRRLASMLYEQIVHYARQQGVVDLYLFTLTAVDFFSKLGFRKIAREHIPHAIQMTQEFRSLCPSSSICMTRRII
jgi:amino-acid N-acetyltransferase